MLRPDAHRAKARQRILFALQYSVGVCFNQSRARQNRSNRTKTFQKSGTIPLRSTYLLLLLNDTAQKMYRSMQAKCVTFRETNENSPVFSLEYQADYYADPIPSFRFLSGRNNKCNSWKSKPPSCAEMVLRSFDFLLVCLSSLVFGLRSLKPTSATAAMSGAAPSALRSAQE